MPLNYLNRSRSSLTTDLYTPKSFIGHAALLRQGFPHCAKFPTAASRRSLGRISIPVWLIILSDQLPIIALVSRYLTNKLIGHKPIPKCDRTSTDHFNNCSPKGPLHYPVLVRLSAGYPSLWGRLPMYYSPVRQFTCSPKGPFSLTCMC